MVERIAGVIYDGLANDLQPPEAFARKVIAAMREPTDTMIDASGEDGVSWNDDSRGSIANKWRAMIDAALADGPAIFPQPTNPH